MKNLFKVCIYIIIFSLSNIFSLYLYASGDSCHESLNSRLKKEIIIKPDGNTIKGESFQKFRNDTIRDYIVSAFNLYSRIAYQAGLINLAEVARVKIAAKTNKVFLNGKSPLDNFLDYFPDHLNLEQINSEIENKMNVTMYGGLGAGDLNEILYLSYDIENWLIKTYNLPNDIFKNSKTNFYNKSSTANFNGINIQSSVARTLGDYMRIAIHELFHVMILRVRKLSREHDSMNFLNDDYKTIDFVSINFDDHTAKEGIAVAIERILTPIFLDFYFNNLDKSDKEKLLELEIQNFYLKEIQVKRFMVADAGLNNIVSEPELKIKGTDSQDFAQDIFRRYGFSDDAVKRAREYLNNDSIRNDPFVLTGYSYGPHPFLQLVDRYKSQRINLMRSDGTQTNAAVDPLWLVLCDAASFTDHEANLYNLKNCNPSQLRFSIPRR